MESEDPDFYRQMLWILGRLGWDGMFWACFVSSAVDLKISVWVAVNWQELPIFELCIRSRNVREAFGNFLN